MDEIYVARNDRPLNWMKAKYVSSRIRYCAWERFILQGKQLNNGKATWPLRVEKHSSNELWEWMENQLNSSGKFSQNSHIADS